MLFAGASSFGTEGAPKLNGEDAAAAGGGAKLVNTEVLGAVESVGAVIVLDDLSNKNGFSTVSLASSLASAKGISSSTTRGFDGASKKEGTGFGASEVNIEGA